MKKVLFIVTLLFTLSTVGCGNKSVMTENNENLKSSGDSPSSLEQGFSRDEVATDSSNSEAQSKVAYETSLAQTERKVIDSANLIIETVEFDKALPLLEDVINKFNGYVESSNILQTGINIKIYNENRSGEFVVRIPNDNFESFLNETGKIGVIINKSTDTEDISSQYYDREARLKVLNAQEERYLEILTGAKDIKEILEVEKSLVEIRYEIEGITGYLKQMDNLVAYSTVNIHIQEVLETSETYKTPVTFGEKVSKTFTDSLKSLKTFVTYLILFLTFILPYVIILGILGCIVYEFYKFMKNKRKNK